MKAGTFVTLLLIAGVWSCSREQRCLEDYGYADCDAVVTAYTDSSTFEDRAQLQAIWEECCSDRGDLVPSR